MLRLYNTFSRSIEDFKPQQPPVVTIYSCGPTVYDYQHIGHMRRYVGDDILQRALQVNNYQVHRVMNITDVGHLVSDADEGEDKMEKGARKFGKTVWEIAEMFTNQFKDSCKLLNIKLPQGKDLIKATDTIKEQIALIKTLEEKGFTYKTTDGIYFDTSRFPDYFKLSRQNPEELKAGARVDIIEGKKNVTDFALWKFSYPNGRSFNEAQDDSASLRQMEWESPWGVGFPGWHIECSAMSMKAFGPTLDIHTGGIDHINIHHSNEIAQSEAATGKQFVKYWVHHGFLMVEGEKMSKSLGNIFTVQDIIDKGYDPLSLRYLYFQTHYRQEMNFTWEALNASRTALKKLRSEVASWESPKIGCAEYEKNFIEAVNDDLNIPKALSILWEVVKSDYPTSAKAESVFKFDKILGFDLSISKEITQKAQEEIPEEVKELVKQREEFRKQKSFHTADRIRQEIHDLGYEIEDKNGETIVKKSS